MTVKEFDRLSMRDFENGAVLDEIRESLSRQPTMVRCINCIYWGGPDSSWFGDRICKADSMLFSIGNGAISNDDYSLYTAPNFGCIVGDDKEV